MKRPVETPRERTSLHGGVAPVSVVVQFVDPACSAAAVVDTGAAACTSGAVTGEATAAASWRGHVAAEPKPPRVAEPAAQPPGATNSTLGPSPLLRVQTLALPAAR